MSDIEDLFSGFNQKPETSTSPYEQPSEINTKRQVPTDLLYSTSMKKKLKANDDLQEDEERDQEVHIKHQRSVLGNCIHEEYLSEDSTFTNISLIDNQQKLSARQFNFRLDSFQQIAMQCIENKQSVLVSAHTSAGKTAVAEYAIATCLRDKYKVIYTSPIKALSNQKYRELQREFQDVGLLTGDVTINPTAQCLVMTTEILRSMIYKGASILKEVAWVIFDEVHYMRDKYRGVVWEESIILLSNKIRFLFLSATIPNAGEFASWIVRVKQQSCHVVYTEYRPVPLKQYVFPSGGQGFFEVVNKLGEFKAENLMESLRQFDKESTSLMSTQSIQKVSQTIIDSGSDLKRVLKKIIEMKWDPVIVFSFSKHDVENHAKSVNAVDLTDAKEKESIETVFSSAVSQLSEEDQRLQQVCEILPLLRRGIGIHHGGLIPIIKEIIEIMFASGWLKILFATETLAMGLNMPAKTVVFTNLRKYDGDTFRNLKRGEYIQMSGRAGRRGQDTSGVVIMIVSGKDDSGAVTDMLKGGQGENLNSSFHLRFNMLIHSLRSGKGGETDSTAEAVVAKSLLQYQTKERHLPELREKKVHLQQQLKDEYTISNQNQIASIHSHQEQVELFEEKTRRIVIKPQNMLPFLQIGRLVRVQEQKTNWGWGLAVNFHTRKAQQVQSTSSAEGEQASLSDIVVVDFVCCMKGRNRSSTYLPPQPAELNEPGSEIGVIPVHLKCVYEISTIKFDLPPRIDTQEAKFMIRETLLEIHRQFPVIPRIDPLREMKILDSELFRVIEKRDRFASAVKKETNKLMASNPNIVLEKEMRKYLKKLEVEKSIEKIETQVESSSQLTLKEELSAMKRVLRRLGYVSAEGIVELKGQVACEITVCDEVLITELLFANVFSDLTPLQLTALLSCVAHEEPTQVGGEPIQPKDAGVAAAYETIQDHVKRIHQVFVESKMLGLQEEEYLRTLNPSLIETTAKWCEGYSFAEVCRSSATNTFEGTIIRCFRRIDELLRQMQAAATLMGNQVLCEKFKEGQKLIKRGIVFAASLYL